MTRNQRWLLLFLPGLLIALALASCSGGGDSDDGDDDDNADSNDASSSKTSLDAEEWTHEVCVFADAFFKKSDEASKTLGAIDPKSAGARAKIVAAYDSLVAALVKYDDGVQKLPAADEKGGEEIKEIWTELTSLSVTQLREVVDEVKAVPDGAGFADGYDELVGDFRDDNSDQDLRQQLNDLAEEYPAAQDVIDTIDNDKLCERVGGE